MPNVMAALPNTDEQCSLVLTMGKQKRQSADLARVSFVLDILIK